MDPEVLKLINGVHKRINEVELKLEQFLLSKHETNAEAIAVSEEAVLDLASLVSELVEGKEE